MHQAGFDDWELILVDDGSTDASTAMAKAWAASDPARIRYIEHDGHENLGMSASRNLGVAVARGRYVAFLDCDDVWLPSALAHRTASPRRTPRPTSSSGVRGVGTAGPATTLTFLQIAA